MQLLLEWNFAPALAALELPAALPPAPSYKLLRLWPSARKPDTLAGIMACIFALDFCISLRRPHLEWLACLPECLRE